MLDDEIAIEVEKKTHKIMPLGANEMRHAINNLLENGWIEQVGKRPVSVLGREEMQSLYCITPSGRNALVQITKAEHTGQNSLTIQQSVDEQIEALVPIEGVEETLNYFRVMTRLTVEALLIGYWLTHQVEQQVNYAELVTYANDEAELEKLLIAMRNIKNDPNKTAERRQYATKVLDFFGQNCFLEQSIGSDIMGCVTFTKSCPL